MEGGQWVTAREFDQLNRRMDGFEKVMTDTAKDVKSLLAARNREEGANEERRELLDATRDKGARKIAWASLGTALLGSLYWASAALAKFLQHTPHH